MCEGVGQWALYKARQNSSLLWFGFSLEQGERLVKPCVAFPAQVSQ